jgi:hypothetical protein
MQRGRISLYISPVGLRHGQGHRAFMRRLTYVSPVSIRSPQNPSCELFPIGRASQIMCFYGKSGHGLFLY